MASGNPGTPEVMHMTHKLMDVGAIVVSTSKTKA